MAGSAGTRPAPAARCGRSASCTCSAGRTTAGRRTQQRRRLAGDLHGPLDVLVQARQRPEQPPRVRVARAPRSRTSPSSSIARPAYITTTSSASSATTPRSCVIIMIAMPNSACRAHQVEDLRLRRHVERGRRLVGDQEVGVVDRAPSRSSRAGASRRRTGADSRRCAGRARDADGARAPRRARARAYSGDVLVEQDRLGQLRAERLDRVQRGHRVLEDHRDARSRGCRAAASGSSPIRFLPFHIAWPLEIVVLPGCSGP